MVDLTTAFDDSEHPVRFKSSLGEDLVVQTMTGEEEIGRLFCFQLQLLSHKTDLHFDKIVGESVTVVLDVEDGGERYFNGIITEFSYVATTKKTAHYHAVVRPAFWLLTQTTDCRIFQNMMVPDIIKEILSSDSIVFDEELSQSYESWEYCVQYNESKFDFISRLMEQEGIFYYFRHDEGKHTLVIADDSTLAEPFPGGGETLYQPPAGEVMPGGKDHLDYWTATQSIQPNNYVLQDFDFTKPNTDLIAKSKQDSQHSQPGGETEIFSYPGEYSVPSEGDRYAKIRLQELRCKHERINAGGPCRNLSAGYVFTLTEYPRADQNKDHLVISVVHQVNAPDYFGGDGSSDELYRCEIVAVDKNTLFRTERTTPKPIVRGPQTAIVTGSEEIHTDEHARVKVQFHWDRLGEKDENSSCFIRVSQLWAGRNWGAIHIPRRGQEVVVSFMEGDPDRPIITGRVYNDEQKPPYDLPADKTISGIKSDTTRGENELHFEDQENEERIYLHAQKDFEGVVENKRDVSILGEDEDNPPDKTIESLEVEGQREVKIRGNDKLTVSKGSEGRIVTVEDGSYELKVAKKDYQLNVDMGKSTTKVSNDISTTSTTGKISTTADVGDISIKTGAGKVTIDALTEITLTVGSSSLKIDMSGVTIKGPMITIDASGMLDAKGKMTMINGSGMAKISGGLVMIN